MDFSQCQTPPPMSSPNLMFPSTYNNSYSMDGSIRSMSVSDDDIASRHNNDYKRGKLIDDEYNTDSDDLSLPQQHEENNLKIPKEEEKKRRKRKTKSSQRARAFSSTERSDKYLKIPINESDDNYDDENESISKQKLAISNNLPKGSTKLHLRSFSESNIHRDIQNNQWPSSDDSDDTFKDEFDVNNISNHSKIKERYVSMKRKYKKQRRISQQFQNAITVIQDDNEDNIVATEKQLREQLEKEYELKLIQLEHQKLNMNIHNDDKMKQILSQNEELMLQNKQLQQQVANQVAMIQQQQHIVSLQQQQTFVRMASGDSIINGVPAIVTGGTSSPVSVQSPLAALGGLAQQFPQTQPLRRISSTSSTMNTIPALPFQNIQSATQSNLGLNKGKGNKTPSIASSQDDNYTLNGSINITHFDDDVDEEDVDDEEEISRSETSGGSSVHVGDILNKDAMNNMESRYNHNNNDKIKRKIKKKHYPKQKRHKHSKRKKLQQLETRLLLNDEEIKEKIGDGLTPWDRFLDLMTPSFCSCSPNKNQQKSIAE